MCCFCRLQDWHALPHLLAAGWELSKVTFEWERAFRKGDWGKLYSWNLHNGPNLQCSSDPDKLLALISSYVTSWAWEHKTPTNMSYIKKQGSSLAGMDEEAFAKILEDAAANGARLCDCLDLCLPIGMHALGCAANTLASLGGIQASLDLWSAQPIIIPPYNVSAPNRLGIGMEKTASQVAMTATVLCLDRAPSFPHPRILTRRYLPTEELRSSFDEACLELKKTLKAIRGGIVLPPPVDKAMPVGLIMAATPLQLITDCANPACLQMIGRNTKLKVGKGRGESCLERDPAKYAEAATAGHNHSCLSEP